jgi:hypothetical protein
MPNHAAVFAANIHIIYNKSELFVPLLKHLNI